MTDLDELFLYCLNKPSILSSPCFTIYTSMALNKNAVITWTFFMYFTASWRLRIIAVNGQLWLANVCVSWVGTDFIPKKHSHKKWEERLLCWVAKTDGGINTRCTQYAKTDNRDGRGEKETDSMTGQKTETDRQTYHCWTSFSVTVGEKQEYKLLKCY